MKNKIKIWTIWFETVVLNILIIKFCNHVDLWFNFETFFADSGINGVDAIFPELTWVIFNLWYKAYFEFPSRTTVLFILYCI